MAIQGDYNLGPMQGLNLADLTLPFPVPPPDYSQAYGAGLPVSAEPGIVQSASTSPLNLPTQPDIPASSQPGFNFLGWLGNTLQSTGAGLQGRPDPVIQRRLQEAQMKRQEEQAVTQKFNVLFDFVKHMDVDEKTMAQLLGAFTKTFPDTGEYLKAQGINLADISIGRKGEKLTLKNRDVAEGQYIDPVTKQPITAGKYDIEGEWKRGQFTPKGFSPTEKEAKTYDQLLIDEAQRQFPKDTKAQEAFVAKRKKEQAVQIRVEGARGTVEARERGYQNVINERLDRISRETAAMAGGRPLDQPDRAAIGAMRQTLRVAGQIKDEFKPEEITKYVGFFNKSAREIAQIVNKDPKFARLNTLINTIKGTAFAEGGKQLTPFEASITFGHIPTGTEFSAVDFITKLDTTVEQTTNLIEDRMNLATRPRGQGLPPRPGQGMTGAGQPSGGEIVRNKSKSGKPIISKDGGKTWEYE